MSQSETFDRLKYRIVKNHAATYYFNGKGQYHREDGPAIEWNSGGREWWVNGSLHREGGPAVERSNGSTEWYQYGKLHRDDGPAIEGYGASNWFLNGVRVKHE